MSRTSEMLIALEEGERIDIDAVYVFIPGVGIYPRSELSEPKPDDDFCAMCTPPELYPLYEKKYGNPTR